MTLTDAEYHETLARAVTLIAEVCAEDDLDFERAARQRRRIRDREEELAAAQRRHQSEWYADLKRLCELLQEVCADDVARHHRFDGRRAAASPRCPVTGRWVRRDVLQTAQTAQTKC